MPAATRRMKPAPDEEPVAVDLGVGRVVAQRAQEQLPTSASTERTTALVRL